MICFFNQNLSDRKHCERTWLVRTQTLQIFWDSIHILTHALNNLCRPNGRQLLLCQRSAWILPNKAMDKIYLEQYFLFVFFMCVIFGLSTHKLIWVYLVFPFCNKLGSFTKFLLQLIFLLKSSESLLFSYDFKENRDEIMKSFWTQGLNGIGIISEWKGCRTIRFSVRNVINVRNREPEVAMITDLIMLVSHFCILLFF